MSSLRFLVIARVRRAEGLEIAAQIAPFRPVPQGHAAAGGGPCHVTPQWPVPFAAAAPRNVFNPRFG
jgi:hypothetical protein